MMKNKIKNKYTFEGWGTRDLVAFVKQPPHDCEFNELKQAAIALAERAMVLQKCVDKF